MTASRMKAIMTGLKADDDGRQLAALSELCELLSLGTEESMGALSVDSIAPLLVQQLRKEHNPDLMLLASRALCHMIDALPSSGAVIVHCDAVPLFCERLICIEYIDLAEQSLQVRGPSCAAPPPPPRPAPAPPPPPAAPPPARPPPLLAPVLPLPVLPLPRTPPRPPPPPPSPAAPLIPPSTQALEKLSHEHPLPILRAGGMQAVLQYVDFFATGVQVTRNSGAILRNSAQFF